MKTKDWARLAAPSAKLERMEAYFSGYGFAPHRHDTYAIGLTVAGVHNFNYRKVIRHSLPGNAVILHPDELHDGEAGTQEGFHYKILYIQPELIQNILGGQSLPFVPDGVSKDTRITSAVSGLLDRLDNPLESLEEDDGVYDLVQAMSAVSNQKIKRRKLNYSAAEMAREYILNCLDRVVTLEDLELITDTDRWSLSRDFRALYGTSPYRYLTLRRLDKARAMIRQDMALVDTAISCGFTDQSHMTHHFTKNYGITPGRWAEILSA
ncbi:AraC family transcriptional regulator [Litoribacillus peritrichatus]|uniref:AraC family transcriptional regulator n=2 Tax=Litoribacillus peritrichatus TaxID=718191 RepID=A0ABP7NA39_9GAMM